MVSTPMFHLASKARNRPLLANLRASIVCKHLTWVWDEPSEAPRRFLPLPHADGYQGGHDVVGRTNTHYLDTSFSKVPTLIGLRWFTINGYDDISLASFSPKICPPFRLVWAGGKNFFFVRALSNLSTWLEDYQADLICIYSLLAVLSSTLVST